MRQQAALVWQSQVCCYYVIFVTIAVLFCRQTESFWRNSVGFAALSCHFVFLFCKIQCEPISVNPDVSLWKNFECSINLVYIAAGGCAMLLETSSIDLNDDVKHREISVCIV